MSRSTPFADNQNGEQAGAATATQVVQQMGTGSGSLGSGSGSLALEDQVTATAASVTGEFTAGASSAADTSGSWVTIALRHPVSSLETASANASSHVADLSIVQTQHEPPPLGSSDEDSSSTQAADDRADDRAAQELDLNDMD